VPQGQASRKYAETEEHDQEFNADHSSQLAVELAKRYNGEIINGDAMQLYTGLPIITNKITTEEQQGVPHHLLGCIGLQEPTWVVGTFVRKATSVIEEIRARGRLPILVGGTHYYTQSLLFHDRLADADQGHESEDGHTAEGDAIEARLQERSTEDLLLQLQEVDPVMAGRWHPKDRRKIQRSLALYLSTGRKASEIYAGQQQRKQEDGTTSDGEQDALAGSNSGLRYSSLLFWLHAENDALRARLDMRVDKMLEAGLVDEVQALNAFAQDEAAADVTVDETRGIWVSIGYKEFKAYGQALSQGTVGNKELERLKQDALEKTKIATRQYAKRQIRWIRIKLLNELSRAHVLDNLYLLDATDTSTFDTSAVGPAVALTEQFLAAEPMAKPCTLSSAAAEMLEPKREDLSATPSAWTKQHCDVCNVTCVVEDQWLQHTRSKVHRKLVSKRRRKAVAEASSTGAHSTQAG
jgi:tRNA dimethylallyltransferase